jgi:hypothetical protein
LSEVSGEAAGSQQGYHALATHGIGEEASSFLASFLAGVASRGGGDWERLMGLASAELEVILGEVSGALRVSEAVEAMGGPAPPLEALVSAAGADVVVRALESSVAFLTGGSPLDWDAVEALGEAAGWARSPVGMEESVAASAAIITIVSAFHRSAAKAAML